VTSVTRVPLLDLRRSPPGLDDELARAFARVLESGHYILGPEVDAFEAECAAYVGARHAIAVSSGTDALLVALMALGVGAGDEVVCPTYSFFATAGVIFRLGARPVFVDSHPACFNLDPAKLDAAITERTRAIVPVHLFGQCADMTAVCSIAARHGIPVVEDAAQAIGAEHSSSGDTPHPERRRAGTFGAFGCFSFFPSKNLGAFGDAGLVTTDDPSHAEAVRVLRSHGGKPKYHHAVVGGNFRIDALQAALLRVKLPRLDAATERRQANASHYTRELLKRGIARVGPCGPGCDGRCANATAGTDAAAPVVLPPFCGGRHVVNQYVIVLPGETERDRVRSVLAQRGVGTEVYYPLPLHLQPCFSHLGYGPGDFPIAERLATESLALPIFPELTHDELDYVVASLADAVGRR
jgi:dTDP-4-amino-4,6-dideoxygalactose transaminase